MIDPSDLKTVRTVNLDDLGAGTVVSDDLSGDDRTLVPLQAALGYEIAQTLFIGPRNVVIQGVTDLWYLTAVADYLRENGWPTLGKDITLTPAEGAQRVSYLVSLLAAHRLRVVVPLDSESNSHSTRLDLVKSKLIRRDGVQMVADAFLDPKPTEADIEDLLDSTQYTALAENVYCAELAGRRWASR